MKATELHSQMNTQGKEKGKGMAKYNTWNADQLAFFHLDIQLIAQCSHQAHRPRDHIDNNQKLLLETKLGQYVVHNSSVQG